MLQGGFKKLVRKNPRKARAGASLCRGLRWFRRDFGSHRSKLRGWCNSAGGPLALCGQRNWWTHQRHRGDCRGHSHRWTYPATLWKCWGQSYRWDAPAALSECRGQCPDTRAGTQGPPTPKLGGQPIYEPVGTIRRTGLFVRHPLLLLFNLAGAFMCFFHWGFTEQEVVVRIWAVAEVSYCVSRSWTILAGLFHACSPGSVVSLVWYLVLVPIILPVGATQVPCSGAKLWSAPVVHMVRLRVRDGHWCRRPYPPCHCSVWVTTTGCSAPHWPCVVAFGSRTSSSRSLCLTFTCLFLPHRVSAHHADFEETLGCNH